MTWTIDSDVGVPTGKPHNLAVLQQRATPDHGVDDFPTPPWGTRALCEIVIPPIWRQGLTALDPCAGRGDMVRALTPYFKEVIGSEKYDYSSGYPASPFKRITFNCIDYLTCSQGLLQDWHIFNPPFVLAEEFVLHALNYARVGVACLCRTALLESAGRYNNLYRENKPNIIAQFVERLPMVQARLDAKASTATAYCWLVWFVARQVPVNVSSEFMFIPPCRAALENAWDYPTVPTVGSM